MATFEFTKLHGCGNDYICAVAWREYPANPPALARRLSMRRFGVGADGLILALPSEVADVRMEMYNPDGSRAEMCGNGIRCLARLVYEQGVVKKNPMRIATDAGIKTVSLKLAGDRVDGVTVDMGEPEFDPERVPVAAREPVVDAVVEVGGRKERVTALSMGNPHCVVFTADDRIFELDDAAFATLGRQFEHHPLFPRRVNTEFVRVLSPQRLRMRVWERGAGETLACGTGACAAVVAGARTGRCERSVRVDLRGGTLEIEWRQGGPADNHVFMTGEAVKVYEGRAEIEEDGTS